MDEFENYLMEIGFTSKASWEKIRVLFNVCSDFCGEKVVTMFISEYTNKDESRIYDGLFIFTEKFIVQIKNPLSNDFDWEFDSYTNNIESLEIKSSSYDYDVAGEESKLSVSMASNASSWFHVFKASGNNCDHLWRITKEYLKPNVITR